MASSGIIINVQSPKKWRQVAEANAEDKPKARSLLRHCLVILAGGDSAIIVEP